MDFSATIELLRQSGTDTVRIGEDWTQGRPVFGGLVAALCVEPLMRGVPAERLLRSVSVSFVAPVEPGDLAVSSRVLRQGRSVSQLAAEAVQGDATRALTVASFGRPRASVAVMPSEPLPLVEAPEQIASIPYREGESRQFTQFFEYRYCIGSLPFTGATTRDMGGWIRFRDDSGLITPLQLLGLIDAWPPALLPLLNERAPSSSLTWFVEFVQPLPVIAANDWLLYQATVDHARDGYGQTQARLWTRTGELVALSRQTVAVFG